MFIWECICRDILELRMVGKWQKRFLWNYLRRYFWVLVDVKDHNHRQEWSLIEGNNLHGELAHSINSKLYYFSVVFFLFFFSFTFCYFFSVMFILGNFIHFVHLTVSFIWCYFEKNVSVFPYPLNLKGIAPLLKSKAALSEKSDIHRFSLLCTVRQ